MTVEQARELPTGAHVQHEGWMPEVWEYAGEFIEGSGVPHGLRLRPLGLRGQTYFGDRPFYGWIQYCHRVAPLYPAALQVPEGM